MTARAVAVSLCAAALALAATVPAAAADAVQRIPRVVGLTTVRVVADHQGDYESIGSTTAVGSAGYTFVVRADIPEGPSGKTRELQVMRRVPMADHLHARTMRGFYEGDPAVLAGTTPGVSADIINELRRGERAAMTFLDQREIFGLRSVRSLRGTVARVGTGTEDFPVIVNGRRAAVRVLHAKGRLADDSGAEELEFQVLDDPDNPLMLSMTGPGFATRLTRIDFPQAANHAASIETKLAANEAVDIYGIYFAFGSDRLRPESDRMLQEVADLLKRRADWKLQVDGHTDNIGGDAANLDLSRRRAAAVKTALVQRYAIAAPRLSSGGFGEGRPKDRNDTIEGRALNRRVELRRE